MQTYRLRIQGNEQMFARYFLASPDNSVATTGKMNAANLAGQWQQVKQLSDTLLNLNLHKMYFMAVIGRKCSVTHSSSCFCQAM